MNHIEQMMTTHPLQGGRTQDGLSECIDACTDCLEACNACADACLGEQQVEMLRRCIRLNNDCADLCDSAMRILSRQTQTDPRVARAAIEAVTVACQVCGEECENHAEMHEHCRICAEACRRCEKACERATRSIRMAA